MESCRFYPWLFARPLPSDQPSEALADYVFMSNLASQQITGSMQASTTGRATIHQLVPGPESEAVLACVTDTPDTDAPGDPQISRCPSTGWPIADAADHGDATVVPRGRTHGWVLVCFPAIDDTGVATLSPELDVDHLPLPGDPGPVDGSTAAVADALVAAGERLAEVNGRTTAICSEYLPLSPAPGDRWLGERLSRRGYTRALSEKVWLVPLESARRAARSLPALPAGYRLVSFANALDQSDTAVTEGLCRLFDHFAADAPHGGLPSTPGPCTPSRLAESDRRAAQSGIGIATAVIVDSTGSPVAAAVAHKATDTAQAAELTSLIVDPAHRGSGFGAAVSAGLVLAVADWWPTVTGLWATVADGNQPVIDYLTGAGATARAGIDTWMRQLDDKR
ncbi:GNAT family N-acetyltransferase [Corynebacterium mendelii]|uniref:GNAT family N-acetyltransferase n=1 Tax=Corynebacterium mendelii TaxID=2765362 RepID=A0A939E1J8_9CORY|nr:GNAT family N-acetyltransferase [Corynebacterium mendelii]MBN9644744.1 GNAT family N-acetyltransferase [Corynebacterium mendelii]